MNRNEIIEKIDNLNINNELIYYILENNINKNLFFTNEVIFSLLKNLDFSDEKDVNALSLCFLNNKNQKLNLIQEQWDFLVKNTNLSNKISVGFDYGIQFLHSGDSPLQLLVENKKSQRINISEENMSYIIRNTDFKNDYKDFPIVSFTKNKDNNLNLSKEDLEYIIKNSDLKHTDCFGNDVLLCAVKNNKKQNLKLSVKQLDYLIKNSNLWNVDDEEMNAFSYIILNNMSEELYLTTPHFNYLIKNSRLEQSDLNKKTAIMLFLQENKIYSEFDNNFEQVKIGKKEWDIIYKKYDLNLCDKNGNNFLDYMILNSRRNHLRFTSETIDNILEKIVISKNTVFNLIDNFKEGFFNDNQIEFILKSTISKNKHKTRDVLMSVFNNNKANFQLSESNLNLIIENTDLNKIDSSLRDLNVGDDNALMYMLKMNFNKSLEVTESQVDYILKNTNLKHQNLQGKNALMVYLSESKMIKLNQGQLNFLIENTDKFQKDVKGNTIEYYLERTQVLLSEEQKHLINNNKKHKGFNKC